MSLQSTNQIGLVIRNGNAFNSRNWTETAMTSDSIIQSVQELFNLLEKKKINYVLVGGVALLHYVEGRNTQDLDLLMALSSLKKLTELKVSTQERDFARASFGELQIDVLLTQNPLLKKFNKNFPGSRNFSIAIFPSQPLKVCYC